VHTVCTLPLRRLCTSLWAGHLTVACSVKKQLAVFCVGYSPKPAVLRTEFMALYTFFRSNGEVNP